MRAQAPCHGSVRPDRARGLRTTHRCSCAPATGPGAMLCTAATALPHPSTRGRRMDSITTDSWDILLWSFWFFIWIAALMVWFRCLFDLFGDRSLSGWAKGRVVPLADLRAVAGCVDLSHCPGPEHDRAADGSVGGPAGRAGEVHPAGGGWFAGPADQTRVPRRSSTPEPSTRPSSRR